MDVRQRTTGICLTECFGLPEAVRNGENCHLATGHGRRYIRDLQNGGEKTAGKAVGRTRGGLNTKIQTIVDGLGNPLYFQLSAGNINDSEVAVYVLSHVDIFQSNVLADKAYGTNEILDYIQHQDSEYTIPPRKPTRRIHGAAIGCFTKSVI